MMKKLNAKPSSNLSPEDLEAIIKQVKNGSGFGLANPNFSALATIISKVSSLPKKTVLAADFTRVRDQVMDRIYIPNKVSANPGWFASMLPRTIRISVGVLGSILIVVSLTLGTAVAALESVPGQSIYPLKKFVENIQLRMASDEEIPALQIKFANTRLEELEKVLAQTKDGKLSEEETQKIVADTVKNLQESTVAASKAANSSNSTQSQVALLNKLVAQSAVLMSAAIETEGETKIEIEKALEVTKISQEEAIANIERAGLKVEANPIVVEEKSETSQVKAHGKITDVTESSVSIGTARFLVTKTTKFANITLEGLKVGTIVDIKGEVDGNKTYAIEIAAEASDETQDTSETQ